MNLEPKLSGILIIIKTFAQFLSNQGYPSYIMPELPKRSSVHVPYIFTREELKRIFEHIDNLTPSKVSTAHTIFPFLFRVLYGCGLRISEAVSLLKSDVDIETGVPHIRHGKNDRERIVPMSKSLLEAFQNFMEIAHLYRFTVNFSPKKRYL